MHSSHYAFSSLLPPIRRVGYLFATEMKLPVLFASVPVRLISDIGVGAGPWRAFFFTDVHFLVKTIYIAMPM